ncbi:MAG: HAD-IIB family hydrolase [Cyanobacteria bacterium P01_G01_bin.4]
MKKLLVFTDLDATLVDHQTYSYEAALPAIARLKQLDYPIIFNSSKTIAEQQHLRAELDIQTPFIVENGAAVVIPPGTLDITDDAEAHTEIFGSPYKTIVETLANLRQQYGYQFRGFSDLDATELAEITGLPLEGAIAAKQRQGTEPLLWEDDESRYEDFVGKLAASQLTTTRGGRFRHVMSNTNKGKALDWLAAHYCNTYPDADWTVVALGDSPNDLEMLRVADIGVLIPNPHRPPFEATGISQLVHPQSIGPAGWAEAIATILGNH